MEECFRNESQKYKHFDFDVSGLFYENNSNSKMIHSVPSPLLCESPTSQNRSGSSKLVKRPSVDSGIYISCSQSSENSSHSQRSKNTKLPSGRDKLSRYVVTMILVIAENYRNTFHQVYCKIMALAVPSDNYVYRNGESTIIICQNKVTFLLLVNKHY